MYHAPDPEDERELILAAYCPACAIREFGERPAERNTFDY
jgi:hypothetical protein